MSKIKAKLGRFTAVGLGAGYVEEKSTDFNQFKSGDLYTEFYKTEGVYYVRQYDYRTDMNGLEVFCRPFDSFMQARYFFDEQPGSLKP